MGKTLTIADDELGAKATVRIEQTPAGQPIVTLLQFEGVDGQGLSREVFRLMEDMGLRLPAQAPEVKPAARKRPAPAKKSPAKKVPAARRPAPPVGNPAGDVAGLPDAPSVPALAAAPDAAPAAAPAQRRYRAGPPPGADDLREVFRRLRGDHKQIAAEYGCSVQTVGNWLRKAREGGATINLLGLPGHGGGDAGVAS